jgi:opacity protein-like surface antigen
MKSASMVLVAILAFGVATAHAQAPAGSAPFATFVAGGTFGHTSGALFGVEGGWPLNPSWDVVVELGRMLNTATGDVDAAASTISQFLSRGGTSASFSATQPATYFDGGVRYRLPPTGRFEPYAGLGVGVARVSRDVEFAVNGNNVTDRLLPDFGVQLGADLAGSESKALVTLGIGAQFTIKRSVLGDVSYRYGRVFLTGNGLNTNRLQFGIGMRF